MKRKRLRITSFVIFPFLSPVSFLLIVFDCIRQTWNYKITTWKHKLGHIYNVGSQFKIWVWIIHSVLCLSVLPPLSSVSTYGTFTLYCLYFLPDRTNNFPGFWFLSEEPILYVPRLELRQEAGGSLLLAPRSWLLASKLYPFMDLFVLSHRANNTSCFPAIFKIFTPVAVLSHLLTSKLKLDFLSLEIS